MSIGKAKVSYELSGPNANAITQADIDVELAQLSIGLGYSF